MFWRHTTTESGPLAGEMGAYVRARFRLALEFATLGTYGLHDPLHADRDEDGGFWTGALGDGDGRAAGAARGSEESVPGERPATARGCFGPGQETVPSSARPHAAAPAAATACNAEAPGRACAALEHAGRARLRARAARRPWLRHFRAGETTAPQQPCTWAAHEAARRGPRE